MMRRCFNWLAAALVGLALPACSVFADEDCEDISCVDELVVEIHPVSGAFQPGAYTVNLTSGAQLFTCTVAAAGDAPGVGECTPPQASLSGSLRCEGDACRPEALRTHQVMQLVIPGNPRRVTLRVERDGALLAERAFSPSYEVCGCEPNGHFGAVSTTVD